MSLEIPLHWIEDDHCLSRVFVFKDFSSCVLFVDEVARLAESVRHHPDISIFDYRHVKVILTTRENGNRITELDYLMADQIGNIYTLGFYL
jgi:4a-hydroxytetrahydrobiopterin dehydratase